MDRRNNMKIDINDLRKIKGIGDKAINEIYKYLKN